MTTLTVPARRSNADTWLLILMLWQGLLAVAGAAAVYLILTSMPGGLRFVMAGLVGLLAALSAAAVPLIHRRDHRDVPVAPFWIGSVGIVDHQIATPGWSLGSAVDGAG